MILTVNTNAALDRVIFIERFEPATVMRAKRVVDSVGGKGLDAAVVLQVLGAPHLALSFIAGETGETLVEILKRYGVQHELVWVEGETRIANVIVETGLQRHSHIMTPGYAVTQTDCEVFLQLLKTRISAASWVILAGSLPDGVPVDFYYQVIKIAEEHGVRSLIDCPGDPTQNALAAKPTIVKMNRDEFAGTFGIACESPAELAEVARLLVRDKMIANLVITCGGEGILAVTPGGSYLAMAPRLQAVNAAGAGDAVSAGLAYRFSSGDSWAQALRWAAATSAAVVLTEGTAECTMSDIERIYPKVDVKTI